MKRVAKYRDSERGSAGAKFIITLAIIFLVAHAGYNYIPVAYEAETIRGEMQTAVLQGLAMPGQLKPAENVKSRIQKTLIQNSAPKNALLDIHGASSHRLRRVTTRPSPP